MVAIVSGNSLGLGLTSWATLGDQRQGSGAAAQGRSGERAFVNVSTGNLVLQQRDDLRIARGEDVASLRTYNSQGLLDDDNADNWRVGAFGQRLELTGTPAGAGSSITRTGADGARAVYLWDAATAVYRSSDGDGAFDSITYDAPRSEFVWTDGDSRFVERYQAASGRLLSASDASGNTLSFAYNADGTLRSSTSADGEATYYDYTASRLQQVRTVAADGTSRVATRYTYDTQGRLASVVVDLSPEDGSIADGRVYTTLYTYDGSSTRVASIGQSDGSLLRFTYVQAGGSHKVASVTDALGATTRFDYDNGATRVTDPLGAVRVFRYSATGQLLQAVEGVTAARPEGLAQTSYSYDAAGNVTRIDAGGGQSVLFAYDARGNLLTETDASGSTRTRTWSANNQLLTDTLQPMAGATETTRYVYAPGSGGQPDPQRLRFVLSAQGNVTEHRYDAWGQRTASIHYAAQPYDVAGLAASATPTEAQLAAWAATQSDARNQRTDYTYDARGALASTTLYAATRPDGSGDPLGAQTTLFQYDQQGRLLQRVEPPATGRTDSTTRYVYDGLDRLLATSSPAPDGGSPVLSTTQYDDAAGRTVLTLDNGLVRTSAYDQAGRLVSLTESAAGTGQLGTTRYHYDAAGRLLLSEDPTGARQWTLYDAAGRRSATVDGTGALVEYIYNARGLLSQTIAYLPSFSGPTFFADPSHSHQSEVRFEYDAMNRQVRSVSTSTEQGATSTEEAHYVYDQAGNRILESGYDKDGNYNRVHAYDDLNRLISSSELSGQPMRESRKYDGAGRVVYSESFYRARPGDAATERTDYRYSVFDQAGRTYEQRTLTRDQQLRQTDGIYHPDNRALQATDVRMHDTAYAGNDQVGGTDYLPRQSQSGLGYDAAGNLMGYEVQSRQDAFDLSDHENGWSHNAISIGNAHDTQGTVRMTYERRNGQYLQASVTSDRQDLVWMTHPHDRAVTQLFYDANGCLSSTRHAHLRGGSHVAPGSMVEDPHLYRTLVNDAQGRALYVGQGAAVGATSGRVQNPEHGYLGGYIGSVDNPSHVQRQLIVGGEVLARYGDATDKPPTSLDDSVAYRSVAESYLQAAPIDARNVAGMPATYTVNEGDTLASIARTVLGDANLWYRIAEANGLVLAADSSLAVLIGWFTFRHRWRETGQTGFAMRMAQPGTKKERVKQAALGLAGLLAITFMMAWTSIHFVAWVAYLVSRTPVEKSYGVMHINSVTAGYSFDLRSRSTGEEVSLRVPPAWASGLRVGMTVCAQGRSSMFGTVIESLKASDCLGLQAHQTPLPVGQRIPSCSAHSAPPVKPNQPTTPRLNHGANHRAPVAVSGHAKPPVACGPAIAGVAAPRCTNGQTPRASARTLARSQARCPAAWT